MNAQLIAILAISAVVVVVLIGAFVLLRVLNRRKAEQNRQRASGLRSEAAAHTGGLQQAEHRAREADHVAEGRRVEAEKAEAVAAEAHRDLAVEQAQVEDQVRLADRVDPDVDHRAKDYTPQSPTTATSHPEGAIAHDDGTYTYPDGSVRQADGSTVDPGT